MGTPSLPGQSKDAGAEIFVLEKWGSLNTKASRAAIPDNDFSYSLNFFPIGDGNLRTLYAEGATIYTASGVRTILYKYMFNLSSTLYAAVFLDNGTAVQVRVSDGATTSISSVANTFSTGGLIPSCAQHGADSIIIVSTVGVNGYWIWNGTSLFGAGSLGLNVTITNGGSGYSSAPTLTAYGGSGSGATFANTLANGAVALSTLTNPGSGYLLNDQVVLAYSGGGSDSGAAATATVTTSSGGVSAVIVTNPGTGATSACHLTISGGGGSGAQAVISSAINGQITGVIVINPGTGYGSVTTIAASDGSGFAATVIVSQGQVTAMSIATGGTNYQTPPTVTITGDGVGATGHATISAGVVNTLVIDNAGYGYSYAMLTLSGGNNAATAIIGLMPFGVAGDTVELYQQRAWVGDGSKYLFTAPGSITDFAASSGGGVVPLNDSFTRYKVTKFIQNNYLYRLCDSSVNVISNVQTSGVPATTSFNDQNVDPQVGTSWPNTVQAFGRATMFANPTGVYALFGGAAQKVSDQLDGLFANASFNTGATGIIPSGAVFDLFSIKVYGFLFTTINPYTKQPANLLAIWDGKKWFLGNQIKTLKAIATQEINSTITAWGDDGTNLFPMFQSPSSALQKVTQTKLSQLNSYIWFKQVNRFYVLAQTNDANIAQFQVGIDTETGAGALVQATDVVGELEFLGQDQNILTFLGAGGVPIDWTVANIVLYGYNSAVIGRLIGTTITTTATDATLISTTGLYEPKHAPYA